MSRAVRLLAAVGASLLLWWPTAAAQGCVSVPGGTELRIEELGRVIFSELTTDRVQDLVTFGGGVCLELGDVEVRVQAETMTVRAPGPHAIVEAQGAVVDAAGWRLGARRLALDPATARLDGVTLEGSGIVGRAASMEIDLESGSMVGHALEVLTPTVRLVATLGSFLDGDLLIVENVIASTCDCPPETASLRIEGRRAQLTLAEAVVVVEGGLMVIEGLRVPLPNELRVSEASLASIRIPISLGVVAEGDRGLVVGLLERTAGDVTFAGDVAFGPDADPRWSAALAAAVGGASVAVAARDGALAIGASQRLSLAPGWDLVLAQRNEGGTVRRRLQDSSMTLEWRRTWSPEEGRAWTIEARGALTAAASAQAIGSAEAAHGRGRLAGSVTAASPWGTAGQFSVRLETGATRYAALATGQAWLGVAPRWRWSTGPLVLDVRHTWRGATGASPFDERLDRVDDASLSEVRLAIAGGEGWRVQAAVDARYDWRPAPARPSGRVGLERLRASAGVTTPHLGAHALAWEAGLLVEAAGALDPRADRDAFVRASLAVATGGRAVEASVSSEIGTGPIRPGMRSLTFGGAGPFAFAGGDVVVTPYLALDVWPLLAGTGSVRLAGHGLALRWDTCCGLLDVGYRALPDGSVTTSFGFAVVARHPDLDDLR